MIATFTDFGTRGPYLGQMKAVLFAEAPGVSVVDVFPDLPAFDARAAAYLLPAYSQYLPQDCICLCVVDPGVGTGRAAVMVRAGRRWYVGPDNGLFAIILRRASRAEVFEISWRPPQLSASFHGRDLFAPVAAMLARGERPQARRLDPARLQRPSWPDDLAEVVYIDGYGNAITGLRAGSVGRDSVFDIVGRRCRFSRTFGEATAGEPFWYENSNGLVEIALAGGSAADQLGVSLGDTLSPV